MVVLFDEASVEVVHRLYFDHHLVIRFFRVVVLS